ncbi:MAG: winged helix-turn-helix domain-containing protein [Chloroflexota bacterium]|nr:winged helix-turn-helix domain-containing protein [Chloroflexota bacterium]
MDSDSGLPRGQGADMPEVLTALLSSRVRYKLLALFVAGQDEPRHARQLAKETGEHFNSVWQELKHLQSLGLLASEKVGNQVRYRTDPAFPLLPELRQLMRKAEGQAAGEQTAGEQPAAGPRAEPRTTDLLSQPAVPTGPRPAAKPVASFIIGEVD